MARSRLINFSFRVYRRPFDRPLATAWGKWSVREGILLRCQDARTGAVGFGEIAPLPHFGTESLFDAVAFLGNLKEKTDVRLLAESLAEAPLATAFGIWAALRALDAPTVELNCRTAVLMNLAPRLGARITALQADGVRTIKFKVGLKDAQTEATYLEDIIPVLADGTRIRLDPNRSWSRQVWNYWQPWLHGWRDVVEFVEEPFPAILSPQELQEIAANSPVPLALDESLIQRGIGFWRQLDWPGYWVIKPSLFGSPANWLGALSGLEDRIVLSSAFETGIGLSALISLAGSCPGTDHGLGVQSWFNDQWQAPQQNGRIYTLARREQEQIWNTLPKG